MVNIFIMYYYFSRKQTNFGMVGFYKILSLEPWKNSGNLRNTSQGFQTNTVILNIVDPCDIYIEILLKFY
jgi:hypothetical protein